MNDIKASRYNYYMFNAEKELLIYNSLNYEFVKISNAESTKVIEKLNSKEVFNGNGIFDDLASRGIFVSNKYDELDLAYSSFLDTVNNDGMLSVLIVLTEDCNMKCPYCFEEHRELTISTQVMNDIVSYVKNNISKYRGLYVYWFGGEPLLEIDKIEYMSQKFIEICNVYKKIYMGSISTNGYYLTLETMERLVECNVVAYQITVDGVKCTHDKYRICKDGSGSFETIKKNLIDIKENMNYGYFTIDIRTNFTCEIYEHVDEFIDFLVDNFANDSRFRFMPRTAVDLGGDLSQDVKKQFLSPNKEVENDIFCKLAEKGEVINCDAIKGRLAPGGGVCYATKKNHIGIDTKGNVFCCSDTFQTHPENNIGKLEKGKLILDKYENAKWIKNWENIDDSCKDCYLFPVCFGGGCALLWVEEKKHNKEKRKNCAYEKKIMNSVLLLFDKAGIFTKIGGDEKND